MHTAWASMANRKAQSVKFIAAASETGTGKTEGRWWRCGWIFFFLWVVFFSKSCKIMFVVNLYLKKKKEKKNLSSISIISLPSIPRIYSDFKAKGKEKWLMGWYALAFNLHQSYVWSPRILLVLVGFERGYASHGPFDILLMCKRSNVGWWLTQRSGMFVHGFECWFWFIIVNKLTLILMVDLNLSRQSNLILICLQFS